MKEINFEEAKKIVIETFDNDVDLSVAIYNLNSNFGDILKKIITDIEYAVENNELKEISLGHKDINALKLMNTNFLYLMLEEKHENVINFVNAVILLVSNWSEFYNVEEVKESCDVVNKLLLNSSIFTRLLVVAQGLINKYEYMNKFSPNSLIISKDYLQSLEKELSK